MVIELDIMIEKRPRGKNLRPDLSICREIWDFFRLKYPIKEHRDKIIQDLIMEQIENEIVDVPEIEFKLS